MKVISKILIILGLLFILFQSVIIGIDYIIPKPTIVTVELTMPKLDNLTRFNSKTTYSDIDKVASLTFDDGPNPEYTRAVMDILDKYHIKGTFFLLGSSVETYPDIVKEMHDRGHIIGSHSYSHPDMLTLSGEEIRREIVGTANIIEEITGEPVHLYRLPYGSGNQFVIDQIPEMTSIMWNVDSEDWALESTKDTYNNVIQQLTGDDLILFHDRLPHTVEALDLLIQEMLDHGYFFDTPDKLDFNARYF